MTSANNITSLLDGGGGSWNLPEDEERRQAIPALRGYAYQLHASLAAWTRLPEGALLYLEAAEDYAEISADPSRLEAVLEATQVKDTRESGSVTLNSADVKEAIRNYWRLRASNAGRRVRLIFLTTSPVGRERRPALGIGLPGLDAWTAAASGGDPELIRRALVARFQPAPKLAEGVLPSKQQMLDGEIAKFLADAPDDEFRDQLLRGVIWSCGAPSAEQLEADNRDSIIELGDRFGATPELSARAAEILLGRILASIVQDPSRQLTRADLITAVQNLTTVRVPAQLAMQVGSSLKPSAAQALEAAGAWRAPFEAQNQSARRELALRLKESLRGSGTLWLHGATGLGKTTLAELVARQNGGVWRILDLRDLTGSVAAERLRSARSAVATEPDLVGVLIDDLPTEHDTDLEISLAELSERLRRHRQVAVFTSRNSPSRRLMRAAGLTPESVEPAPAFTVEEVGELVLACGGEPATWSQFVWLVGGSGHPQLVDVVCHGLASRGWPRDEMNKWINAGLQQTDVEEEREAIRQRLLRELSAETYDILIRTTCILGTFDRELAIAVASAPPPISMAGANLDRLTGHWIEKLGPKRLRTSPLVGRLAVQMFDTATRRAIDRVIAESLVTRKALDADLADTAAIHASMAEADDLLVPIVVNILTQDAKTRARLAAAMPGFRTAGGDLAGVPPRDANLAVQLRLAQFLFFTAGGEFDRTGSSLDSLLAALEDVVDQAVRPALEAFVLMKILIDEHAAGRLPQAWGLIDRLEKTQATGQLKGPGGEDPLVFSFLLHAVHGNGVDHLEGMFAHLDGLAPEIRRRRLAPFQGDDQWIGLAVDNAWLSEVKRDTLSPTDHGSRFRHLAHMALKWGETNLAARCLRVESILLDEYSANMDGAIASLDEADSIIVDNVILKRARAKIYWRHRDYAGALSLLTSLADRLETLEPLETAFALREAAQSAAELGRWTDAASLFGRAAAAAARASDQHIPFELGLLTDAAASRFESGQRSDGLRALVGIFERLADVNSATNRQSHYIHLIARHVALWMQARYEDQLTIDGEPIAYLPGSASNLEPSPLLADRQITPLAPAWWMLARVGLRAGLAFDEVLGWKGVADLEQYAVLAVGVRVATLQAVIQRADLSAFEHHLRPAIDALVLLGSKEWQETNPDPVAPRQQAIRALRNEELAGSPAREHLEDAVLAMAACLVLKSTGHVDLTPLRETVLRASSREVLPELYELSEDQVDARRAAAGRLCLIATGEALAPRDLLIAHLRLLHAFSISTYKATLQDLLASRVQSDWTDVLEHRGALLSNPLLHRATMAAAIGDTRTGFAYVAAVLSAAIPATALRVDEKFRTFLRELAG